MALQFMNSLLTISALESFAAGDFAKANDNEEEDKDFRAGIVNIN